MPNYVIPDEPYLREQIRLIAFPYCDLDALELVIQWFQEKQDPRAQYLRPSEAFEQDQFWRERYSCTFALVRLGIHACTLCAAHKGLPVNPDCTFCAGTGYGHHVNHSNGSVGWAPGLFENDMQPYRPKIYSRFTRIREFL